MSCIKEGCKEPKTENAYCKKHKVNFLIEEGVKRGERVCANVIRGCRVVNDLTYTKSRCEPCLEKDRARDKARRMTKEETEEGTKQCNTCSQIYPLDQFVGKLGETKTCFTCREDNKRADAKRDMDHTRELARSNEKKPERRQVKQAWKDTNVEKCATYWMEYRKRQIQKDLDAYLKKNAAQAKKWRDANPEKVKQNNLNKKNNINSHYKTYQMSASDKKLDFKLSVEEFEQMVSLPCYYCGIIQEKGYNGIDRLHSSDPYIKSNCVSCCEMCNMMKGTTGPNTFVGRVEHILTHLKVIDGQLCHEDFVNIKIKTYNDYKKSSEKKGIFFDISQETFNHYKDLPCYLCGKEISDIHSNGIDRFDNTKGYIVDNIRSCCATCNYIKRNHEYESLIQKLCLICNYQQDHHVEPSLKEEEIHPIVKGDKMTPTEREERATSRKDEKRKALSDRYGSEEYIKEKSKEIALKRIGM